MAVIETWLDQDLQKPVQVKHLDGNLFSNNGNGNRIGVAVYNNGEPVTLTGTVSGYAVLADGTTVPCTGTRSGNKASILIPPAAYLPGAILISVFLTDGTTVTTLAAIASTVIQTRTNTQVDPGSVVTDWTQTINAAMQSVENAAENLGGIIATPYPSLTYPVPLGKYTYYNNNLYRCISPISASEEFTAAHWTQVRLGDDVSDLNRAITDQTRNLITGKLVNCSIESNGTISANQANYDIYYAPVSNGKTYTVTTNDTTNRLVCGFFTSVPGVGSVASSGRIVQTSMTITSSINGYIAFRTMQGYQYAQIEEGTSSTEYITPLTAYDKKARAAITTLETETIKPREVPANTTLLSSLVVPGIYSIDPTLAGNITDKPTWAVSGQYVTVEVRTGFYQGQRFIIQDYYEFSNKVYRRLIRNDGTVTVQWILIQSESGVTNVYEARSVGTATAFSQLTEPGSYNMSSSVFDNITDPPEDAEHNIYNLYVNPKSWSGGYIFQRLQCYDGKTWDRTLNANKTVFQDWHRVDAAYIISQQSIGNCLHGKKLVTAGDSYTAAVFSGDYAQYNGKNFGYYISQRNEMTFVNSGINGSTMAIPSASGAGERYPFSEQRYLDVPADTDYLTLWFGINDSAYSTLGTIDDTENTTFYGAWNKVLEYYLTNRPFMKILIIVTTIGVGNADNAEAFKQAIRDVATKWGYPVLDWNKEKTIPAFFEKDGMNSTAQALRKNAFGWNGPVNGHPNPQWHIYESTIIENALRSI